MDASGQRYPIACDMEEVFLHMDEEASGTGKGNYHQLHISEDLLPCVHAHPFLVRWDFGQDLL